MSAASSALIEFRKACSKFATGVTVVTVADGDRLRGMTANSFTSVSLDPPLVLISIDSRNRTHRMLSVGSNLVISVLATEQTDWADRFSGRQGDVQDRFDDIPHTLSGRGLPVIDAALATFECTVVDIHPAGDHSLFIGRVDHHDAATGYDPLIYFGGYRHLGRTVDEELEEGRPYALGYTALDMANAFLDQIDIVGSAHSWLSSARDETGETASLVLRKGDHYFHAVHVQSREAVRRVPNIGQAVPLYVGASGRVLLAGEIDGEIDEYLEREMASRASARGRPDTGMAGQAMPLDINLLRWQIAATRAQGFGVGSNERGAGGVGIAVPVRAGDGGIVAVIQVSGPQERYVVAEPERQKWVLAARRSADGLGRTIASLRDGSGTSPTMTTVSNTT